MGDKTRAQLEALLKFRIGNRSDIDTQLTDATTLAYDELTTSIRVPETQESAVLTLSTSDVETRTIYAVPADLYAIVGVRNATDEKSLTAMTVREYDQVRGTGTPGEPRRYVWWRNELIIHPANDETARTLLMRYLKRLPALSASTSLSALPREWDEVIVQGALFRLLRWLGLTEESEVERAEYIGMVSRRLDRIAEGFFDHTQSFARPILVDKTALEATR